MPPRLNQHQRRRGRRGDVLIRIFLSVCARVVRAGIRIRILILMPTRIRMSRGVAFFGICFVVYCT